MMHHSQVVALGLGIISLGGPTFASSAPEPWMIRAQAMTSDYTKTSTDSNISGTNFLELSASSGFQIALEFRPRPRLGWELAVGQLTLDAKSGFSRLVPISFDPLVLEQEVTIHDRGTLNIRPLTLALLIHTSMDRRFDAYMGPLIGATFYDANIDMGDRDPEPAYGGKGGAEMRLRDSAWSVGIEVRHIEIVHDTLDRDLYRNIGLTTAGIGLSYRPRARH